MKIDLQVEKPKPAIVAARLVNLFELNQISGAKFDKENGDWTFYAITGIFHEEEQHLIRVAAGNGKNIKEGKTLVTSKDTLKFLLGKELRKSENLTMVVR